MSNTYSEFVFLALGTQHAMRMRHIVICGLPRTTKFFHITSYMARFLKEKMLLTIESLFWFSLQLLSETFHSKKKCARFDQKYVLVLR